MDDDLVIAPQYILFTIELAQTFFSYLGEILIVILESTTQKQQKTFHVKNL